MTRFLARRLALGAVVLWTTVTLIFVLFFVAPSDVARNLAGRQATPETVALIRHRLGLDASLFDQYRHYLSGLLHGNLGFDYYHGVAVSSILRQAAPRTLSLVLGASLIWLVVGVAGGVISAARRGSLVDRAVTAVSLGFYSMPSFVLGLLLLYFCYFRLSTAGLHWFPASGYVPLSQDPLAWVQHLVLPWLTLALVLAGVYTRLSRGALLDVLREDYIRTARSKGLTQRRIILRHGLRAGITPVVTQFGIDLGQLIGGVVVTETVFGIDGLGHEAVAAITMQDTPVIIGTSVIAAAAVVAANLLVDMSYALIDPRVRVR